MSRVFIVIFCALIYVLDQEGPLSSVMAIQIGGSQTTSSDHRTMCNNDWTPKCQKVCSNEGLFYISTEAACEYKRSSISCKEPLLPSTRAQITCNYGYRRIRNVITCQQNGEWDFHPWNLCTEICGISTATVGSTSNLNRPAAWNAAIFKDDLGNGTFVQVCSGSIITSKFVLTFINCLSDEPSRYRIAVGKYYTDYKADEPKDVQMLNISNVLSIGDPLSLELAVVKDFIIFRPHIGPICIDNFVYDMKFGASVGNQGDFDWSKSIQLTNTDSTLRNLSIIREMMCAECYSGGKPLNKTETEVRELFKQRNVICFGNANMKENVCRSQYSGAALVTSKSINGTVTKFLIGINPLSASSFSTTAEQSCQCSTVLTYFINHTEVLDIMSFVQQHRYYYQIENNLNSDDSILGYSSIEYCSTQYQLGKSFMTSCSYNGFPELCRDPIKRNTIAEITCRQGYGKSIDKNDVVVCNEMGEWSRASAGGAINTCEPICALPTLPPNMNAYYEATPSIKLRSGDMIDEYASIIYKCNRQCINGCYLKGVDVNYCMNGTWLSELPACEQYCAPIVLNHSATTVHCSYTGIPTLCSLPLRPTSRATMKCAFGYRRPMAHPTDAATCGDNGKWTPPILRCELICGTSAPDGVTYIHGGEYADNKMVPWHVGIYTAMTPSTHNRFRQICGGTILSRKIILSAAHCFLSADLTLMAPSLFRVVTGKYYRDFNANETKTTQTVMVAQIHVPTNYRGYDSVYEGDLAILMLTELILLKAHVVPICIEYSPETTSTPVVEMWGKVAGWGYTEHGTSSPELKLISLPVISTEQCKQESAPSFRRFIIDDKFCAGFYMAGQSVCQGDSGGGLVFPKNGSNDMEIFYIHGIVSNGPKGTGTFSCDSNKYALFTNVHNYIEMIEQYVREGEEGF